MQPNASHGRRARVNTAPLKTVWRRFTRSPSKAAASSGDSKRGGELSRASNCAKRLECARLARLAAALELGDQRFHKRTTLGFAHRRIVGFLLALLGLALFPLLVYANIKLITISSRYITETGGSETSVRLHWPLLIPALLFLLGLALLLYRARQAKLPGK